METTTTQLSNFSETLNLLEEQIKTGNIEVKNFEDALKLLNNYSWKLQQLLEYAADQKPDDKKLQSLYSNIAGQNASYLIDELRDWGYKYSEKAIREAFENQGYRLLEQTRYGKRDMVFYGILRIFVSQNKILPKIIVEAFKPIYSQELFKVFIFSFLSGILWKEE